MKIFKVCITIIAIFTCSFCMCACPGVFNEENFYLGDSQEYKGLKITVNSIEKSNYYLAVTGAPVFAKKNRQFIVVELTIENNTNSEISFFSDDFHLIDSNGVSEEAFDSYKDNSLLDRSGIKVYETVTDIVRFYVSSGFAENEPLKLKYNYTDYEDGFLWKDIELNWILSERP